MTEPALRSLTWRNCGVIRNGTDLSDACTRLRNVSLQPCSARVRADFELRNMHQVAYLIAAAALAREESRGAHFRTDFPQKYSAFQKHSILRKTDTGFDVQIHFA